MEKYHTRNLTDAELKMFCSRRQSPDYLGNFDINIGQSEKDFFVFYTGNANAGLHDKDVMKKEIDDVIEYLKTSNDCPLLRSEKHIVDLAKNLKTSKAFTPLLDETGCELIYIALEAGAYMVIIEVAALDDRDVEYYIDCTLHVFNRNKKEDGLL